MLVDKSDLGFGKRSWRYSMLVRDGVIEKMFIEPEKEGDPFEVSDADTMLTLRGPEPEGAGARARVRQGRLPALRARQGAARVKGLVYEEVALGQGITSQALRAVTGQGTTPQVFIGGKLIGGADELERYFSQGDRKAA